MTIFNKPMPSEPDFESNPAKLVPDKMALPQVEALEDAKDLSDVLAVLKNPGKPIPMAEIRIKYGL